MIIDGTSKIVRVLALVGGDDKGLATSEGVELIVLPALNELVVPDGLLLTSTNGDVEELVEFGVGVVVAVPERLAVLGIIATVEALLGTVVDDGDTGGEEGEHESITILPGIGLDREETSLIVVVDESAENAGVLEVLLILLETIAEVAHGLGVGEHITHGEVHGVAQNAVKAALITGNVADVTVVVLTNGELADGRLELLPEGLLDFSDSVDAEAIAVISSDLLDVLDQLLADESIGLVEIRKARETAVLDFRLVIPVLDVAASRAAVAIVVVVNAVEGDELVVPAIGLGVTHVVADDIDHKIHATVFEGVVQVDKVIKSTKVFIDSSDILGPVAMIALVSVLNNRTDPDSIEAHALDVVELVYDTLEHATAISGKVTRR